MKLKRGDKLGPYQIVSAIGKGGMGEVWSARDPRLNRSVAIKVSSQQFTGRFEREAQAIAALNHPNVCTLFDVGPNYLVMELVDGPTLAGRIAKGPIPVPEALNIGRQIASALEAAHAKGIIHRDLKPANIKIRLDGSVKVLDFGLATAGISADSNPENATLTMTAPGLVMGTPGYMSPEQVRGERVTPRADLFSFGVILYEMLTADRPFTGTSAVAICNAILHTPPRDFGSGAVPGKLKAIIRKLLEKEPSDRYISASEIQLELNALSATLVPSRPIRLSGNVWIAAGMAVVLTGVLGAWLWHRSSREGWAREVAAPEIARLIDEDEYEKAAALTLEARAVLPNDPTLGKLWIRATGEASIASEPSGAVVSIRPYRGNPSAWETIGKTPLIKLRVPANDYVWQLSKPGFAPLTFLARSKFSAGPGYYGANLNVTMKLRPEAEVPNSMVVVPGGTIGLGYPLEQAPTVRIERFLIDQHEVSNEEYRKFVDAGGYQKRELWKQPFLRDGHPVSWEDAMALFHDGTGRPGPATWEVGDLPRGREKYPVAGISWYEAAAYAEFAGKSLPSAYQWRIASQAPGFAPLISLGGNFRSDGTQPVGSADALSGFGTTDMAGNVKEWCLNEAAGGTRLILGGGFGEPGYMFDHSDVQSPWERRPNFGFRCAKPDSPPSAAATSQVNVTATARDFWREKPAPNAIFKAYAAAYAYDKAALNAKVEEITDGDGWSLTKVSFDAAYGRDRLAAYIILPKSAAPPYQTVMYFPGSGALSEKALDLAVFEYTRSFLLKSGRAVVVPVYQGMYERQDGFRYTGNPPASIRDHVVAWSKDLGRTIDYLETRKDIDSTKLAYFGDSLGAAEAPVLTAIDKRIRAMILSSGGFHLIRNLPEVEAFNFAPHATAPALMLNGRYDSQFPLESSQRPLFHYLGAPDKDKKEVIYEGGHGVFPRPAAVRECLDWLDKYLGPARR